MTEADQTLTAAACPQMTQPGHSLAVAATNSLLAATEKGGFWRYAICIAIAE